MIRLRGQWVPMDPSSWNAEMDLAITVGLGVGNRQEQIGQANDVLATMAELQRSPFAWLVDAGRVHNALKRKLNAAGIRNVGDYLVDPAQAPPPEPQPDAEVQARAAELQAGQQEARLKLELIREEAAAKLQLERDKATAEIALARERMAAQMALERERMLSGAAARAAPGMMRAGGALDQ